MHRCECVLCLQTQQNQLSTNETLLSHVSMQTLNLQFLNVSSYCSRASEPREVPEKLRNHSETREVPSLQIFQHGIKVELGKGFDVL